MNPLDAAYHLAAEYPGGAEALALRLSKLPATFRAELAPSPGVKAKLGLLTAIAMTNLTNDPRIVHAFNAECGYCPPLPLPTVDIADGTLKELLERGADLSSKVCDIFSEFQKDVADGDVSPNELDQFENKALRAIAALTMLARSMRAKMEVDQRSHIASVTALKRES